MKDLVIISRSPENAYPEYEGHAFYEYFYDHMAEKFNVIVLSGAVKEKKKDSGITYYPWKEHTGIKGAKGLFRALNDIRPDIIFSENSSLSAITAFSMGKLFRSTTVLRVAGVPSSRFKNLASNLLAEKKVAVSETVGKHLYGKYEVICPGTDFPESYEREKKDEEKTIIGYLGRFHRDKGTDRLVELAEEMLSSDKVEFKVAGYGEFQEKEIKELDQKFENFEYKGKIPNEKVFTFLSGLDALFMPSRSEGMPRTPIESMYVGTPVIAWDIPPHREIIKDENLLVESLEEAKQSINQKNYETGLEWFGDEEFTVENEMRRLAALIEGGEIS